MEGSFRRRPSEANIRQQGLDRTLSAEYLELPGGEAANVHGVLVRTISKVMLDPNEASIAGGYASWGGAVAARASSVLFGVLLLGLAVWRRSLLWAPAEFTSENVVLKLLVPAVGSGLCWLLAFSPLPTLLQDRFHNQLSVDPTPFPVYFTAAFGWCIFAIVSNDPWPFIGNLPPLLSFFFCTTSALRLCRNQRMAERLEVLTLGGVVIIVLMILLTLSAMVVEDPATRRSVAGTIAPSLTCWQAMAPSIEAVSAIRRRDARLLSLPLSIAGMMCSLFWTIYGVSVEEPSIYLPNGMLLLLSAFNAGVKLVITAGWI